MSDSILFQERCEEAETYMPVEDGESNEGIAWEDVPGMQVRGSSVRNLHFPLAESPSALAGLRERTTEAAARFRPMVGLRPMAEASAGIRPG
jgi:hypothetical protein